MSRIWVRLAQLLLLFVLGYYLIYKNLILNWQKLGEIQWELGLWLFVASLLFIAAVFMANSQIWRMIVLSLGPAGLRPYRAAYIWFVSNLGRYLPGKMWQIAGMAMMARAEGVSAVNAATSAILGQVISILSGAAVGLIFLPGSLAGRYAAMMSWARIGLPFLLALLYPPLLSRLLALVYRMTGKSGTRVNLRPLDTLVWFLLNVAVWLAYGLCFYYFILSVIPGAAITLPEAVGVYAVGYIIGFLAFFAPGGLGVRELLFVGLLSGSLGVAAATVVALVSRIWLTLAELVPLIIMLAVSGLPGARQRNNP